MNAYWRVAGLLAAGVAAGCGPSKMVFMTPPDPPLEWPEPPAVPQVRLLGLLQSAEDVTGRKSAAKAWDEMLYGPAEPDLLDGPSAVAVDDACNRIAVSDASGACVHVFDLSARTYDRKALCGVSRKHFECPVAVAWCGSELWVADAKRHAIAVIEADGPGRWIGEDVLQRPAGLAYDRERQRFYVSDGAGHCIAVLDSVGKLLFKFGSRGSEAGQFSYPGHVACAPDGTLVVADLLNFRVQRFDADGRPVGQFGKKGKAAGDLALPKGVAVDPEGNIWVVDAHFHNVQGFTPEGRLLIAFGKEGDEPGDLSVPAGACIDAKRRLWVADTYNHRVQIFELRGPDGRFAPLPGPITR